MFYENINEKKKYVQIEIVEITFHSPSMKYKLYMKNLKIMRLEWCGEENFLLTA